jgi:hypothetical protein
VAIICINTLFGDSIGEEVFQFL